MMRCLDCGARTMHTRCSACRSALRQRLHAARGGSGWSWDRIRHEVLERDAHRCVACGVPCPHLVDRRCHQVDHIAPLAEGGTNELSNLRALCRACHGRVTAEFARRRAGK